MSIIKNIFFFRPKKSKNYNKIKNFLNLYENSDENNDNERRLKLYNKNNNIIQKFSLNNIFQNLSFTKIIRTSSYIYISYYTIINLAMFLRKKNPNIFIIKRKLGGTFGKFYLGGFEPKMNINEACLILSVSNKYNLKQIRESHKKLMLLNHPDFGGSSFIACKINEAKDLLMKNYKNSLNFKI